MIRTFEWRIGTALVATAGVGALAVAGCTAGASPRDGGDVPYAEQVADRALSLSAADIQLVSFDSCEQALDQLRAAVEPHVGPYGIGVDAGRTDGPIDQPDAPGDGSADDGGRALSAPEAADAPASTDAVEAPAGGDGADSSGGGEAARAPLGEGDAAGNAMDGAAPAPMPMDAKGEASDPTHSGTNVHTDGVDEADLVKTDGRRVVTIHGRTLRVVDLAQQKLTGVLELPEASEQMLMAGDKILVIGAGQAALDQKVEPRPGGAGPAEPDAPPPTDSTLRPDGGATLTLIDIAGPPTITERLQVDGTYTDARLVDSTARIVTTSAPRLPTVYPSDQNGQDAALEANRAAVANSTVDDWLPGYVHEAGGAISSGRLVDCADVNYPATYSGMSMVNVLTVDLAAGLAGPSAVTILGDGQTVYATEESLYVAAGEQIRSIQPTSESSADERGLDQPDVDELPDVNEPRTEVHKFTLAGSDQPSYAASGAVDGWLINQYAMSEHEGYLRVATTTGDMWGAIAPGAEPDSQSQVVVLAEQDDRLTEVGRVDGLGHGERIHAVRYLGAIGYVVTFREVDPLYTLDLSDPGNPRVLGELKIPGYSAYLHPAGDRKLIGVGQDGTNTGQLSGAQVSLFDVSDLADPRRIDMIGLDSVASEVETNPHAFLYWEPAGLIVVPTRAATWAEPRPLPEPDVDRSRPGAPGESAPSSGLAEVAPNDTMADPAPGIAPPPPTAGGATVLRLEGDTLTELTTIHHPAAEYDQGRPFVDANIRRSLVVEDTLWTVSAAGVMGHDIASLAELAWIPFG